MCDLPGNRSPRLPPHAQPYVGFDDWMDLMRKISGHWSTAEAELASEVVGMPLVRVKWRVLMLEEQAGNAYVRGRDVCDEETKLGFTGMVEAMLNCGEHMYAEVELMTPAQRTEAIIKNVLGIADRVGAVRDGTILRAPPRIGLQAIRALCDSKEAAERANRWWSSLQLESLHGSPLWEEALFTQLHGAMPKLQRLFCLYTGQPRRTEDELIHGPTDEESCHGFRMGLAQWAAALIDMGLHEDRLPLEMLNDIFHSFSEGPGAPTGDRVFGTSIRPPGEPPSPETGGSRRSPGSRRSDGRGREISGASFKHERRRESVAVYERQQAQKAE